MAIFARRAAGTAALQDQQEGAESSFEAADGAGLYDSPGEPAEAEEDVLSLSIHRDLSVEDAERMARQAADEAKKARELVKALKARDEARAAAEAAEAQRVADAQIKLPEVIARLRAEDIDVITRANFARAERLREDSADLASLDVQIQHASEALQRAQGRVDSLTADITAHVDAGDIGAAEEATASIVSVQLLIAPLTARLENLEQQRAELADEIATTPDEAPYPPDPAEHLGTRVDLERRAHAELGLPYTPPANWLIATQFMEQAHRFAGHTMRTLAAEGRLDPISSATFDAAIVAGTVTAKKRAS